MCYIKLPLGDVKYQTNGVKLYGYIDFLILVFVPQRVPLAPLWPLRAPVEQRLLQRY